jgi:hypothetical protein
MLSLEPQVSKNIEPDGSNAEIPHRRKIHPQQARQFVPTETRDNASHCLLRDAPNPPNLSRKNASNNPLYGAWIDVSSALIYNKNISKKTEKREEKKHYENTCSARQSET